MQRIKNIFVLFGILPSLLRKRFKIINNPKRILIIQMAKLGDMVCTTPMFRAVKKKYPNCEVFVMGNSINKELLENNRDVSGYIEWSGDFSDNLKKINLYNFDFGCITGPNYQALSLLLKSNTQCVAAPTVINGRSPYQTRLYNLLLNFCTVKTHQMGLYAPREYLKLLEPIDVFEKETKKHLAFSNDAINKVLPIIGENTLNVVIAPGAGNKVKEWPTERFTEIADYLIDKYKAKVFLIGNDNDHELSKTLISDVKNKNVIVDLCGKLSIDELKAFISRMNLFISVDTGPIYIAEAFDIPTIDIVGPMDENEQPPMSEKHIVVLPSQREKPMMHIMNAREFNYEEARRQILSIETSDVIQAIEKIL